MVTSGRWQVVADAEEVSVESVVAWREQMWRHNGWREDTGVEKAGVRQENASVEETRDGGGERERERM